MAAVDKLRCSDYNDFTEFKLWVLKNNPSLSYNFYNFFLSEPEWDKWKDDLYNFDKESNDRDYKKYGIELGIEKATERFLEMYLERNHNLNGMNFKLAESEIEDIEKENRKLKNKSKFIDSIALPICNFSFNQDLYLKWHCPIEFVRKYLKEQCGVKTRWYHKIYFKK